MAERNRNETVTRAGQTSSPISDKERLIAQALETYRVIYPDYGQPIPRGKARGYCDLLEDLSVDDLFVGLVEAPKVCDKPPVPSQIRRAAEAARATARQGAILAASERRQRIAEAGVVECEVCDDTGFVGELRTAVCQGHEVTLMAYKPCRCRPAPRMERIEAGGGELATEIIVAAQGRSM